MSRYIPVKNWMPSNEFSSIAISDKIIKENVSNLAIIAGPGSGKTEILAQRASFLLQTATCKSPNKILALSFKVDAAANLQKRVNLRCERELSSRFNSWTFDSFFISLSKRFTSLLPSWIEIQSDFDVIAFTDDWWRDYEIKVLDGKPCAFKSTFKKPDLHSPLDLNQVPHDEIVKIWDYCSKNKIVDYSMCRSMAYTIVKNSSEVRTIIQSTYNYLFLDEFQDTTDPQYFFIKTVFGNSDTVISAVGDTNQMIMSFAGANSKNFDRIKNDFKAEIIPLAINHRSNSEIVKLINHVIANLTPANEQPIIYEGSKKKDPPDSCLGAKSFSSVVEEANYISRYINNVMNENSNLKSSDFVLILRQRASNYFDDVHKIFLKNNLHLRNEDAVAVKNGVKIQDLMDDPLCVLWILIFKKSIETITYQQEKEMEDILINLMGFDVINDRDRKKLKNLVSTLVNCIDFDHSIENIVRDIIKLISVDKIKSTFTQYRSAYLEKVVKSFSALLSSSLNQAGWDIEKGIEGYEGQNQVKLMTIHKSKGLEFDTVFFVDFHDDSWWGLRQAVYTKDQKAQREEKNSFFVGLSRAKERLYFMKSQGNWPPVIADLLRDSNLLINLPDLH